MTAAVAAMRIVVVTTVDGYASDAWNAGGARRAVRPRQLDYI